MVQVAAIGTARRHAMRRMRREGRRQAHLRTGHQDSKRFGRLPQARGLGVSQRVVRTKQGTEERSNAERLMNIQENAIRLRLRGLSQGQAG